MKINMKKSQAVSPLIATILLVAVALSLAGILYSWSSQSARETTDTITDTTARWTECNLVKLSIDVGCRYNTTNGLSLILMDNSTVEIKEELTVMIIDSNNSIATTTVEPSFSNRAMQISIPREGEDEDDFLDKESPVRARVFVNSCPDQVATASCR